MEFVKPKESAHYDLIVLSRPNLIKILLIFPFFIDAYGLRNNDLKDLRTFCN